MLRVSIDEWFLIRSLYRRSLKLALDWSVHRSLWRGQAIYIRSLFEANSGVRDPRQQRVSFSSVLHMIAISNFWLVGFVPRDWRPVREMEASRSVSPTDCSWRYVCTAWPNIVLIANVYQLQDLSMKETFQRLYLTVSSHTNWMVQFSI
jgi:hypothetical protein